MTDEELSISDATLIAQLRMIHEWKVGNAAADRIEALEAALKWQAEQPEAHPFMVARARAALKGN